MERVNFKFAAAIAVSMAVAVVLVAWDVGLPVRDPDGVAVPTYIRFPAIVLIAVGVDLLPRSLWRARRSPRTLLVGLREVWRERWPMSHVAFAVSGLAAWYVSYAAFRNLKSYVPFINRHQWDRTLDRLDRALWLGHDPATTLHTWFGTGIAAQFFSFVYVAWIVLVPATLAVALVWTRHTGAGSWYVTAITLDWLLGVMTYFAVPTLGPIYSRPWDFAGLDRTMVTGLQSSMISDRYDVLANPYGTHAVQTIAAFASLHVGITVTVCLMASYLGLHRAWRILAWVFLALTVLSTVYLGWHFFVDTLAGAFIGALAVWISALGTGNHVGLQPRLHREAQPAATDDALAASRR